MSKAPLWALGGVILALAGVSLWLDTAFRQPRSPPASQTVAGNIGFPAIQAASFLDLDGRPQPLGQWHGKLLIVNFWATWCGPCKEEMPMFDAMQTKYVAKNLQIVGIGADSAAKIREFQKLTPVRYPLLAAPAEAIELSKRLGNRLGLLPHTVIFGPDGKQLLAKLGPFTQAELESIITENLPK